MTDQKPYEWDSAAAHSIDLSPLKEALHPERGERAL